MTRVSLILGLLLFAGRASADVDIGGLVGWSQNGAFGALDLGYSPQGFWAVGLSGHVDESGAIEPTINLRLSADLFRLVPRLQLGFGYAQEPTWKMGLGLDYFLMRLASLRAVFGYGSRVGWNLAAGLAWYPFD